MRISWPIRFCTRITSNGSQRLVRVQGKSGDPDRSGLIIYVQPLTCLIQFFTFITQAQSYQNYPTIHGLQHSTVFARDNFCLCNTANR